MQGLMADAEAFGAPAARAPRASGGHSGALPRCGGCRGWGVGLVNTSGPAAGLCNHCFRTSAAGGGGAPRAVKRARFADGVGHEDQDDEDGGTGPASRGGAAQMSAEDVQRLLAEADAVDMPALDAVGVKRMLLGVERAITRNTAARAKHADDPVKYLDSEVELDKALKSLQALAAAPEHYALLWRAGGAGSAGSSSSLRSLLGLLGHENADISVDVIELLKELLSEDALEAGGAAGTAAAAAGAELVDALVAADAPAQLLLVLHRLNASFVRTGGAATATAAAGGGTAGSEANVADDSAGFLSVLELLEAMMRLRPSLALAVCDVPLSAAAGAALPGGAAAPAGAGSSSLLLGALLARVKGRGFDETKGFAAEMLSVLAAGTVGEGAGDVGAAVARRLGSGQFPLYTPASGSSAATAAPAVHYVDGVEYLLEALAPYRKRDPGGADECECVGNLFDALCCCLLKAPANRSRFAAAEGFELMLRLVAAAGWAQNP